MMENETQVIQPITDQWAIVELMGHDGQTAGRVEKPSEWGGLMRVDVPDEYGSYRTEFYGMSAIYSVKFVSEEIARAYAPTKREITAHDSPIVTREEHQEIVRQLRGENNLLLNQMDKLKRRLTTVDRLPKVDEGVSFHSEE